MFQIVGNINEIQKAYLDQLFGTQEEDYLVHSVISQAKNLTKKSGITNPLLKYT